MGNSIVIKRVEEAEALFLSAIDEHIERFKRRASNKEKIKIFKIKNMEKDSLKKQVGGEHYKEMNVQPIELIASLDLNFFQGNVVKYLSRRKGDDDITIGKKHSITASLQLSLTKGKPVN